MEYIDFDISEYREIWELQKRYFTSLVDAKSRHEAIEQEYLLYGEHYPVYTLGFHGNENNLLLSPTVLKENGAEVIRIERGGDITYHGPGQLILYPILDLEKRGLGVKQYMNLLEECVIRLLELYGIHGTRVDGATGVWLDVGTPRERKICAMGVKCRRHITMHGLALNVSTDLTAFSAINPCGFVDKGVTSIYEELRKQDKDDNLPSMQEVKANILGIFRTLFDEEVLTL